MPIRRFLKKYWFKPARWHSIAVYYPVMFPGWVITLSSLFFIVYLGTFSAVTTNSINDFVISFVPRFVVVLLIFDLFCFRTGEYPKWWNVHPKHHRG
ncbi:MAG: hypothetical protein WCI52_02695 [bacterium]